MEDSFTLSNNVILIIAIVVIVIIGIIILIIIFSGGNNGGNDGGDGSTSTATLTENPKDTIKDIEFIKDDNMHKKLDEIIVNQKIERELLTDILNSEFDSSIESEEESEDGPQKRKPRHNDHYVRNYASKQKPLTDIFNTELDSPIESEENKFSKKELKHEQKHTGTKHEQKHHDTKPKLHETKHKTVETVHINNLMKQNGVFYEEEIVSSEERQKLGLDKSFTDTSESDMIDEQFISDEVIVHETESTDASWEPENGKKLDDISFEMSHPKKVVKSQLKVPVVEKSGSSETSNISDILDDMDKNQKPQIKDQNPEVKDRKIPVPGNKVQPLSSDFSSPDSKTIARYSKIPAPKKNHK